MPLSKQEIKVSVKNFFKSKGLKDTTIEKLSTMAETALTALGDSVENYEESLKTILQGYEPFAAMMQSEADAARSPKPQDPPKPEDVDKPAEPANPSVIPQEILDELKASREFRENFQKEQSAKTFAESKALLLKNAKEQMKSGSVSPLHLDLALARCAIDDKTTIESLVESAKAEYDLVMQEHGGNYVPPIVGDRKHDSKETESAYKESQEIIKKQIDSQNI